jgi:hypothetical protein
MILDGCALLIAGGDESATVQARLTYRMGMRLVKDLTTALGIPVDTACRLRLTEADVPALVTAVEAAGLNLQLSPPAARELLRLVRSYDVYVIALSTWLLIPLPAWLPQTDEDEKQATEELPGWED